MSRDVRAKRLKGRLVLLFAASFAAFVLLALWFVGVFGGNVHEVDPGRYYRSAQLSGDTLARVVRSDHVAGIVNLRGPQPGEPAYESEIQICRQFGIRHADVSMSAYRLPRPEEIAKLLDDLDRMPRPLLVHCRGGADRTGLATALYVHLFDHVPLDQAVQSQLTWRYGHIAFSAAHAMDRFFELYRETSHGQDVRTWIAKTYPPLYERLVRSRAAYVEPPEGKE